MDRKRSLTGFTKLAQMGIIALVLGMICFFYVKKVYDPERRRFKAVYEKWGKVSQEIKTLGWNQRDNKKFLSSILEHEKELRKAKAALEQARDLLVKDEDLSGILTGISQIAASYDLVILQFGPVDAEGAKIADDTGEGFSLRREHYRLIMSGSFIKFRSFLKEIGYLPKLVTVENVVIEPESKDGFLKINLLLSV